MELVYDPDASVSSVDESVVTRIPRPLVIPRSKNDGIDTPNFNLVCAGRLGAKVLEDEMYMSEIIMMAEDIGMRDTWNKLPLHHIPTLNIFWEYGVCYPLIRYCLHASPSEESSNFGLVYLHPTRYSMMLWVPSSSSPDEDDAWHPDEIMKLSHEFSLLPSLAAFGEDDGDTTTVLECAGIQAMQNHLFSLGLGPIPFFRRPGVLLSISESAADNQDRSKEKLAIIVSHKHGRHGCCFDNRNQTVDEGDERCYLCPLNPFYEVLFHNHSRILQEDDDDHDENNEYVRITPQRAFGRVVEVGACLLLKMSCISEIIPSFKLQVLFPFFFPCASPLSHHLL